MTVAPETLSMGLSEGDYCWMQTEQEPKDDLALARSPDRLSPRQILQSLIDCGYIRLKQHLVFAPEDEHTTDWQVFAQEQFPDWSKNDTERFAAAKEKMTKDDPTVITILGELVNPVFPTETREVMFIAAGGVEEGLVTARGVYQMRRAMEHAQEKGVPIVFFNAITSADPLFESEVGQISRQISETMALGLRLTVPKITVITGEAASAGAHAAWQIADRTLIFDRGAL